MTQTQSDNSEPTYVPSIQLTAFSDTDGAMSSDTFRITVDGVPWTYEEWHTQNSDGAEFYNLQGENHPTPFDEDKVVVDAAGEVLDALTQAFGAAYYPLWREHVEPVLERIRQEALDAANAAVTQTQSGNTD